MVRETKLEARVEGVTAEAFYEIVYADPAPIKRYHAATNACHHAVATPWLDGRRTVHFTLQVALPGAFQRIVGAGPIPVREIQTVSWDSGCSFAVTSEPEMSFPGAASFPTTVTVAVRQSPGPDPCVDVTALIRCSAGVPWVMQNTVEGLMVDQAQTSLAGFLEFCQTICREQLAAPPLLPKLMASTAAALGADTAAVATPPSVPPPTTPPVPASASSAADGSSSERDGASGGASSSSGGDSDDEDEDVFHDIPSSASSDVSASDSEASSAQGLDDAAHRVAEAAARLREQRFGEPAAPVQSTAAPDAQAPYSGRLSPESRPPPGGYVQRYVAAAEAAAAGSGSSSPKPVAPAPRSQRRTSALQRSEGAAAAADAVIPTVGAADMITAEGAEALIARVAELVEVQASTARLLRDMEGRIAAMELDLMQAKAYQNGMSAALRAVGGGRFATTALAVVATAAAASSITALVLMRRRA